MVLFLLLALSLNVDALCAGLSCGMRGVRIPRTSLALICACSVCYSFLAGALGGLLLGSFPDWVSRWLGASTLVVIAFISLLSALRDPSERDVDASRTIDLRKGLALSVAISLDSIGALLSLSLDTRACLLLPPLIGVCQLGFLLLGSALGTRLAAGKTLPSRALNLAAGGLLLVLALLRILQ